MVKLRPQQRKFAAEYAKTGKLRESYLAAGYADGRGVDVNAVKLKKKPHVKAEIDRLLEQAAVKALLSIEYVLKGLKDVADDETANKSDKIRALELIGKSLAMFTERTVHEVKPYGPPPDPQERIKWLREELDLLEEAERTPPALAV